MKIIIPNEIIVVSSSLTENEYPKWVSNATYKDKDCVIYNHCIYESIEDGNTAKPPDSYFQGAGAVWRRIGPTNYWAAFDDVIATQSMAPEGVEDLEFVLRFDYATAIGLLNLDAEWVRVTVTDDGDSTPFYDSGQISLVEDVDNEWDYEFFPIRYIKDVTLLISDLVLTEVTVSVSGTVKITIHKTGGKAAVGHVVLGLTREPGATLFGAVASSKSFSRVTEDEYGNVEIIKRRVAKTFRGTIFVHPKNFDQTKKLLDEVDAVPTLYIGDNRDSSEGGYQAFTVYGLQKGYELTAQGPEQNEMSISIEGLV